MRMDEGLTQVYLHHLMYLNRGWSSYAYYAVIYGKIDLCDQTVELAII